MRQLKIVVILFISSVFIAPVTNQETEEMKKISPGFFFTMPKTLLAGKNETVCLSTHYASFQPIKVIVDLKIKENHFLTRQNLDSEHGCFELNVPSKMKESQFASIKVQVQLNGNVHIAHNQDPIIIHPIKKIIFVETDRTTYKSDDKIKIRILVLLHNMLPPENHKISHVKIRNPLGIGVIVWENVSTELGLAQLEHQLSRDSIEGKWRIEADGEVRTFEVNKYVLPRFKVDIIHPKVIYHMENLIEMKVCGKYSYGAPVKGSGFIRLTDSHHNMQTVQEIKKMSEGCAVFTFTTAQLGLSNIGQTYNQVDPRIVIQITATVTEYGTDRIQIATAKSYISMKAYSMKFTSKNLLLPGFPYHGTIQLNNIHTDISEEVIEICYNIAIKKSWNYLNSEQCSNFTIRSEKMIQFHILPMRNKVIHLQLNARSVNHTNIADSLLVVRLYSPSATYIMLNQVLSAENSKCRSFQQFSVQYITDKLQDEQNITFYYIIKTRNQIFKLRKIVHNVHKHYPNYSSEFKDLIGTKHKHIKPGSAVGKFILKYKLDENIISNYHLLVYFITAEGEVVSATKEVEIEPCLNNEVRTFWSHKQIVPGGSASLSIQTKSDSLCSIAAIDKAAKFMDDLKFLDAKQVLKPFLQERDASESGRKTCLTPTKKNREAAALMGDETIFDLKRRKRYVYSFSEDYDSYDIFNEFGTITITNFKVITKPCYTGPIPPVNQSVQFLTDHYDTQNDNIIAPIRSFFPETWLWEVVPVRGSAIIHRNLPHTITSWVTNVLCVSGKDGVGFSKTTEITTFQPFFLDVLTPYSIKKGETLYLHVMVFNYLHYNIPIRITLGKSTGLQMVEPLTHKIVSYCLSSNSTVAHIFEMKGTEVGTMNITVLAELDPTFPGHCGPEVLVNKRDVVFKTLLVEPEGYPSQNTKSALLCGNTKISNATWDLQVPTEVIAKTAKGKIVISGDLLGQAIENLEELIVMPTGCGEQIMATLAPNLYILRYLNATQNLMPSIKHRIIRNLKIGYQRILNYAHKDGSFSAFGYHDPAGSMFLTAFVVRTLQEMKRHIYVDQRVVDKAIGWIFNHQLENGCFNTMHHVFQDMGDTSTENSTAGLTSYVIISLMDGDVVVPESVTTNAKYCLRGHYHLDKYTLAISSYALLKVNWKSEADRMLRKLDQISNQKNNMMWWSNRDINGSQATDIEITSYVLLSLLHEPTQENLAKAHSIVRWLTSKQNSKGSFRSTQDTVVALDALTRYSLLINSNKINLKINIETLDQKHNLRINEDDRLKSKKLILKQANNNIRVHVEGQGCILIQAVISYYLKQAPVSDAFKLDMEISPVSNIDECSIAMLSPCFIYKRPDIQANMAVLEVNLPSGYEADRVSLYKLLEEDTSTKVKMFEELPQKVILYFTKLGTQQVCINFNINENAVVQSRSKSLIKLYDYYNPEYSVLQFYTINDKCRLNNLTMSDLLTNITDVSSESNKNNFGNEMASGVNFSNYTDEMLNKNISTEENTTSKI